MPNDPEDDQGDDIEFEAQDLAEVFDEENITADGRNIATSDMEPDVYDVTSSDEDANEALEPGDDFDPDQADEAELEQIVMAEEDLDEPRTFRRDDADSVSTDDLSAADMEQGDVTEDDIETLTYRLEERRDTPRDRGETALDERLKETFPASDAASTNPGSD